MRQIRWTELTLRPDAFAIKAPVQVNGGFGSWREELVMSISRQDRLKKRNS
jgi:hypothetical protein